MPTLYSTFELETVENVKVRNFEYEVLFIEAYRPVIKKALCKLIQ